MRDFHKIKRKIEIQIDNKELLFMFLGGVTLFIFIFSLGFLIGKGYHKAPAEITTSKQKSTLQKPIVPKKDRINYSQAFATNLTAKNTGNSPYLSNSISDERYNSYIKKFIEYSSDILINKSHNPQEKTIETPAPPKISIKKYESDEPSEENELPSNKRSSLISLLKKMEKNDKTRRPEGRISKGPKNEPKKKTLKNSESRKGKGYTIQLRSFPNRKEAERYLLQLKKQGLKAYLTTHKIPRRGTWYRVKYGSFPSIQEARNKKEEIEEKTSGQAIVVQN